MRSDVNKGISIGISIWVMGYRYGSRCIDMVMYHDDMVILDIDMGYGLMIWEMTVSIWSSPISIWDILSLCRLRWRREPLNAPLPPTSSPPPAAAVDAPSTRDLSSFVTHLEPFCPSPYLYPSKKLS